ncbi:MAG: hypothetical protein M0Z99_32085 [Betaproteobacteria bacterium]|nr:hypothetical protein [Betaproteobacteria bacterium]
MTEQTALTVVERASLALGASELEKRLRELAQQSKDILAITNQDGYQQAHSSRMALKRARIEVEKIGKEKREDAQAYAKAVIARAAELIGITEPEERRLQALQDEWDAIEERKRQAEAERIAALQARIEAIHALPASKVGKPSDEIMHALRVLESLAVSDFAEFDKFAQEAKDKALATLQQLHAGALAQEQAAAAERARIEAERVELARLRAEQEERQRTEAARIAQEAQERARAEAEAKARIEAEEAASRARIQAAEAEAKKEADRLAAERKAAEAREQAEKNRLEAARIQQEGIERAAREKEQARAREKATTGADASAGQSVTAPAAAQKRPTDDAIIDAICLAFRVHESKAIEWLLDMDLDAASERLARQFAA